MVFLRKSRPPFPFVLCVVAIFIMGNVFMTAAAAVDPAASSTTSSTVQLAGKGLSILSELMQVWANRYSANNPGVSIRYTPMDKTEISAVMPTDDVDFTVTILEGPPSDSNMMLLPVAATPIVCIYNMPSLTTTIPFTRGTLADIWRGAVTNWNHSAIRASLASGTQLPNQPIILIPPAGNSIQTLAFTAGLSKFSSAFKTQFGGAFANGDRFSNASAYATVQPFVGDPQTVGSQVRQLPNSMSFATLADAINYGVTFAPLINLRNYTTFPLPAGILEDLQSMSIPANLSVPTVDLGGTVTYPLLSTIYLVVRKASNFSCERARALDKFLRWLYQDPYPAAEALKVGHFVVPASVSNPVLGKMLDMKCGADQAKVRSGVVAVVVGGANQPAPAMDSYIGMYGAHFNDVQMTYARLGSQVGIQRMGNRTLDFGATEIDLAESDFAVGDIQLIPVFVSSVAIVCNLPGLSTGVNLFFSREVIVGIWNGTIVNWNDPMITRLNPFVYLTDMPIKFINYASSNALGLIFKRALKSFDPAWAQVWGEVEWANTAVWPNVTKSRSTTATSWTQVGTLVKSTPYTIAIVPRQTQVSMGLFPITVTNRRGQYVLPTLESVAAAVSTATFDRRFQSSLIDRDADNAYPMCSFTCLMLHRSIAASDCAPYVKAAKFARWVSENETFLAYARSIDYIPAFGKANDLVHSTLLSLTCNGHILMPELLPPVPVPGTTLNIGIIIGPVAAVVLIIAIGVYCVYRRLKNRLSSLNAKLNDASIAVELSDAIATFSLEKMAFLESIEHPTTTQLSCLRILTTLQLVKKYIPPAVLCHLQSEAEDAEKAGEDEAEEDGPDGPDAEEITPQQAGSMVASPNIKEPITRGLSVATGASAAVVAPDEAAAASGQFLEVVSLASSHSHGTLKSGGRSGSSLADLGNPTTISGSAASGERKGSTLKRICSSIKDRTMSMSSDLNYQKIPAVGSGAGGAGAKKKGFGASGARHSTRNQSVASSATAVVDSKIQRRAVTVMFIHLANFNALLKVDATDAVRSYNSFLNKINPMINDAKGTIGSIDSEYILVHWNVAKKCASGCILACELSVKLLGTAHQTSPFVLQVGISHGQAVYSTIGCDAMSCFALMGTLVSKVALLQRMNPHYGTNIMADGDVKTRGCQDALFLADIVVCPPILNDRAKIYELVPTALVSRTDYDGEWLYSFPNDQQAAAGRQAQWQQCVQDFYSTDNSGALASLKAFIEAFSSDNSAAPLIHFAKDMICALEAGPTLVPPPDQSPPKTPNTIGSASSASTNPHLSADKRRMTEIEAKANALWNSKRPSLGIIRIVNDVLVYAYRNLGGLSGVSVSNDALAMNMMTARSNYH